MEEWDIMIGMGKQKIILLPFPFFFTFFHVASLRFFQLEMHTTMQDAVMSWGISEAFNQSFNQLREASEGCYSSDNFNIRICCSETNEGYAMVHGGTEDTSELDA